VIDENEAWDLFIAMTRNPPLATVAVVAAY